MSMSTPPVARTTPSPSNAIKERKEKKKKELNFNKLFRETYSCSKTHKLMKHPARLKCGHSFEYATIAEHFKTQSTCPKCKKEVGHKVTPNTELQNLIEAWRETGHGSCATTEEISSDEQDHKG